jgi:hypothetical protein
MELTTEQCFGLCNGLYFLENIKCAFDYIEPQFDSKIEDFKRILIKTDLEEYTEYLLANELYHIINTPKLSVEERTYLTHGEEIELTKTLFYLLSNTNPDITVVFKRGKIKDDDYKTNHKFIIATIVEGLKRKYHSHGYDERRLTFEETKEKFKNFRNDIELKKHIKRRFCDKLYNELNPYTFRDLSKKDNEFSEDDVPFKDTYNESTGLFEDIEFEEYRLKREKKLKIIGDNINEDELFARVESGLLNLNSDEYSDIFDMLDDYQSTQVVLEEINLEWLKKRMQYLGIIKTKKAGAKAKNDSLAIKAEHFSYLIRIRRFINQEEFSEIEKFPLSNADCRLIHDCFVFLGYIEDQSAKGNSTKPQNYIRSLIDNYRLNRKEEYWRNIYNQFAEKGINHFKKTGEVKNIR